MEYGWSSENYLFVCLLYLEFNLVLEILLRLHSSTSSSHPKGPASYDAKAAVAAAGGVCKARNSIFFKIVSEI